jgi:hypothetical protein
MTDYRTKRQKLEAMARQTVSPHEAEVARRKLAAMDGLAVDPASGPQFSPYDSVRFRFSHDPTPTPDATLTAEDLARVRDELRRRSFNDLFDLFGRYTRPVVTPPCERCRHSHMAITCMFCGPLGPCGSTCQRCRHGQHRGGVCYWCAPLTSEIRQGHGGPCAPGYDANWDAYVSGTECPRCHAGHHSPIYCTSTETQP